METLFALYLLGGLIPAAIAHGKGRSGLGVYLLSWIITPPLCLIYALLMAPAPGRA